MDKKYSANDGLKFFEIAGIDIPPKEADLFKSEYEKLYQSSPRYEGFVGTLWDIYSNILPFKAYPDRDNQTSYFEHLSRDSILKQMLLILVCLINWKEEFLLMN